MNIQEKFFIIRSASHYILSVLFKFYFCIRNVHFSQSVFHQQDTNSLSAVCLCQSSLCSLVITSINLFPFLHVQVFLSELRKVQICEVFK